MLQMHHFAAQPASRPTRLGLTFPLALLMAEIGEACDGPSELMGDRVVRALRATADCPGFLTAEQRAPRLGCYARHTVASDPAGRFTLLAIVWDSGQFSPPHAHDTWCSYAVVENSLTETLYRFDPTRNLAAPTGVSVRAPGYACFAPAGLEQIHRLGNAESTPAISLHVYGVEGSRIGTHVNRLLDAAER